MFTRKQNGITELKAVETQIGEKEGKLSQLRTSLKDTNENLETVRKEISAAETEREDILDKFIEGQATQADLDQVRKHFDNLVARERDLRDIIETIEVAIPRTENEIPPLQNKKSSLERAVWCDVREEIKRELRSNMKLVLQGVAVQKLLGSPVHSGMIADLFFDNSLPTPEEIRSGEAEAIKKYLG